MPSAVQVTPHAKRPTQRVGGTVRPTRTDRTMASEAARASISHPPNLRHPLRLLWGRARLSLDDQQRRRKAQLRLGPSRSFHSAEGPAEPFSRTPLMSNGEPQLGPSRTTARPPCSGARTPASGMLQPTPSRPAGPAAAFAVAYPGGRSRPSAVGGSWRKLEIRDGRHSSYEPTIRIMNLRIGLGIFPSPFSSERFWNVEHIGALHLSTSLLIKD